MAKRELTVKVERATGTLNRILVWANDRPIIVTDGDDGEWTGNVPDGPVKLETTIWGQGKAKYTLTIDLPGTAKDQKLELALTNGYHDATYTI